MKRTIAISVVAWVLPLACGGGAHAPAQQTPEAGVAGGGNTIGAEGDGGAPVEEAGPAVPEGGGTTTVESGAPVAPVSGVPSRGFGWFAYPEDSGFAAAFEHFVATTGITPKFLLSFTGSFTSMSQIVDYNDSHAAAWANQPSVSPSTGLVPVLGITLQTTQNDMTLANIPTGAADGFFTSLVGSWATRGYKELWIRLSYEQNFPATTPSNEDAVNAFTGGAPGEPQYTPLAIAALQYSYTKLHAVAAAAGMTIQVIWNPTLINYDNVSPTNYYPGTQYVDIEAVDLYTNNFYGPSTQLTYPGYYSQPAFSTTFEPDGGVGTQTNLKTWASSYDNVAWFLDFTDGTRPPYTGGPGWSLYTAMNHALSTQKPLMIAEYGTISSCDGGGNGGLVDSSGLAEDLNLAAYTRKRIAWFQAQGGNFLTMDLWQCLDDAMLATYGQVWPDGGTK
jgi:hypothetical protein